MKSDDFFAELKRRNVYKVAVAYAVVSWLLTQAASILFPTFEAPPWAMKVFVAVIALGFPAALIFSWAFEITPEGIKLESEIESGKSTTRKTGRKLVGLTVVLAVIAASLFVFQVVRPKAESQKSVATRLSREAKAPISPKSVAVLAFDNLSDDKGSEYFSDGISEELLTVLQKIPGLHVAARTSAFSFKGKNATAQEIGQKLGVAHLVEGSVRKAGNVVRIAARLTRTDTGEQLWSENFTRNLKDVFAVQTELAQTIVGQVSGQLTNDDANPAAKAAIQEEVRAAQRGGTKNVEAHQHYLQGRFYSNRGSEKSAGEALVEYQRAVELDPSFALAWAGLARTHMWYCGFSSEIARAGFDDHLARAREAAARALAIEPNLPEALLVRSKIELDFDFDWNGAAETVRSALALAPADPELVTVAGTLALARGDTTRAIELYRQAVALDPVNSVARSWLAFILGITGRLAEARAEYRRVVELIPAAPWSHAGLGLAFMVKGKFEEAAVAAQDDAAEWTRLYVVAMARWGQKRIPEADAALARLTEGFADTAAYLIADVYAYRGDKDRAFEWLERARRQRDGSLGFMRCDPFLANLHEDPRWDVFLRTMGLADDQLK
jgi:serine/threonine-protein kinase